MRQSGFGIASLIIGIMALLFICCGGWSIAILGIIFGGIGIAQTNYNRGTAIAGFICSLIAFLFGIVLSTLSGFHSAVIEAFQEAYEQSLFIMTIL